ncbi:phosphatase PAP2 family protein [Frankia sp. Cppng1_Ct_nod]|uniref:phosphatase PAP2 family protein n=1 Tax=Frankia sp. Cppng1_Ct_nod TaxID=2897162 RepID=UPI0013EF9FFB|nr:phosphatase PAP2 family protein [Frankia sp. Cppng1_Ct_nod]
MLRRRLWTLIVPCLLALGVLCWKLADRQTSTAIDAAIDPRLAYRFGRQRRLFETVIALGNPTNVALASAALAGLCLLMGARRAALLSLVGPPLAGALTEWVLKPLVDRRHLGGLAFPSGHTTGACAVAVVLVLLLLPGGALRNLAAPVRVLLWYAAAVFSAGVGLGVVVLRYHYATDVVGGAAVAVTVILAFAWTLDRLAHRR